MRSALFLVLLLSVSCAVEPCISCEQLGDAPDSNILTTIDEDNANLTAYVYYENLSIKDTCPDCPTRQPIGDYALLIQLTNTSGLNELLRVYTNADGEAVFDFNEWKKGCINFKVVYCPFCDPASKECGFEACLEYAVIETDAKNIDEVTLAEGQSVPATLNPTLYMPSIDQTPYCPPPEPMAATPGICLPLFIIFAMLAGSLYMTGRNPFAAFNIGGARVGRHIRYQARGRGYSFSGMAAISALATIGRAAKAIDKGGMKGLAKQEKQMAESRNIVAMVGKIDKAVKRGGQIGDILGGKGTTEEKQAMIEASAAGAGKDEGGAMVGKSGLFMPGSSPFSPRIGELFGAEGGYGLGFLTYVATSTTIGGLVDDLVRTTTGEGIFESIFIDYDSRKLKDEAALSQWVTNNFELDESGNVIGMKVELAGGEAVVTEFVPLEDGTKVVTLKTKGTNAVNGEVTVVLAPDTEGELKLQSMSYQVAGLAPVTDTNKQGIGIVTITKNDEGQIMASIRAPDQVTDAGQIMAGEQIRTMTEPVGGTAQEREEWSKLTNAYFQASTSSTIGGIGGDGEPFIDAVTAKASSYEEIKNGMVDSIRSSYSSSLERKADAIESKASGNSTTEKSLDETKELIAQTSFITMGVDVKKPSQLQKLSGFTPAETASKTTEAATDSNMAQYSSGDYGNDVKLQTQRLVDAGVDEKDAGRAASHIVAYFHSKTVGHVAKASHAEIEKGLKANFVLQLRRDDPTIPRDRAKAMAEKFVAALPKGTVADLKTTAGDYLKELKDADLGQQYRGNIENMKIGTLGAIHQAGAAVEGSPAEILASSHCDTEKLPPEIKSMVEKYKDDRAQSNAISYIPSMRFDEDTGALKGMADPRTGQSYGHVDFKTYGQSFDQYRQSVGTYYSKTVTRYLYDEGQIKKPTYDLIMNGHDNRVKSQQIDYHVNQSVSRLVQDVPQLAPIYMKVVEGKVRLKRPDELSPQHQALAVALTEQSQRETVSKEMARPKPNYGKALDIATERYNYYDSLAVAAGDDNLRKKANEWARTAGRIGELKQKRMGTKAAGVKLFPGGPPGGEGGEPSKGNMDLAQSIIKARERLNSGSKKDLNTAKRRLQRKTARAPGKRAPGKPKD